LQYLPQIFFTFFSNSPGFSGHPAEKDRLMAKKLHVLL